MLQKGEMHMSSKETLTFVTKDNDVSKNETTITRVYGSSGQVDTYMDKYVTDKESGEREHVEHISSHNSGALNHDYVGTYTTTHVHQRGDGSSYTFDEDNETGEKDYDEYENC